MIHTHKLVVVVIVVLCLMEYFGPCSTAFSMYVHRRAWQHLCKVFSGISVTVLKRYELVVFHVGTGSESEFATAGG